MAESALTNSLQYLRTRVCAEIYGGDADYDARSATEQGYVDRIIDDGLKRFYSAHAWQFLDVTDVLALSAPRSTGTVTIVAGVVTLAGSTFPSTAASWTLLIGGTDYTVASYDSATQITLDDTSAAAVAGTAYVLHRDDYDLPDDFSAFASDKLTYDHSNNAFSDVRLVSDQRIREWRAASATISFNHPQYAAWRSVRNDATAGTRFQICFWPAVNAAARLTYKYRARPTTLSTTLKYAWGASDHSETLRCVVLAEAQVQRDGQPGPYERRYEEQIAMSIAQDSRQGQRTLGKFYSEDPDECDGYGRHGTLALVEFNV